MAAIAPSAAAAAAVAVPALSRPRKRGSSSRAVQDRAADDSVNVSAPRPARKGRETTSSADSQVEIRDDVITSSATPQPLKPNDTVIAGPNISWSTRLLTAVRGETKSHPDRPPSSNGAKLRKIFSHPLTSSILIMAVAGLITSYLVQWTTWTGRNAYDSGHGISGSGADRQRDKKLDNLISSTARALQVQVEAINSKVENLQREHATLVKNVEKQKSSITTDMSEIKASMFKLDSSVQKMLQDGGPLLRKDVLHIVRSAVDARAAEGGGKVLSLDDVRVAARTLLEEELSRHSADAIGLPDYALSSGGGRVVNHSPAVYVKGLRPRFLDLLPGVRLHPFAQKVLQPSLGVPGQCLPLKGANGSIDVSLRTTIVPSAFTLEHVAKVRHTRQSIDMRDCWSLWFLLQCYVPSCSSRIYSDVEIRGVQRLTLSSLWLMTERFIRDSHSAQRFQGVWVAGGIVTKLRTKRTRRFRRV